MFTTGFSIYHCFTFFSDVFELPVMCIILEPFFFSSFSSNIFCLDFDSEARRIYSGGNDMKVGVFVLVQNTKSFDAVADPTLQLITISSQL